VNRRCGHRNRIASGTWKSRFSHRQSEIAELKSLRSSSDWVIVLAARQYRMRDDELVPPTGILSGQIHQELATSVEWSRPVRSAGNDDVLRRATGPDWVRLADHVSAVSTLWSSMIA